MKHAYVYYRIDLAQAGLAATRIDALLNTMATHCSQPPRRLNSCDDPATWMEVYEGIANFSAFSMVLNTTVQTLNCAAFTLEERHLECFSTPNQVP